MLSKEVLHKEIDALPEEFTEEIYDFVNFLKSKRIKESTEAALLSESSLRVNGKIVFYWGRSLSEGACPEKEADSAPVVRIGDSNPSGEFWGVNDALGHGGVFPRLT